MKKFLAFISAFLISAALFSCSSGDNSSVSAPQVSEVQENSAAETTEEVTEEITEEITEELTEELTGQTQEKSEPQTVPPEEVGYEGMTAVYAESLADGEYEISVDSSSSMFKIVGCKLIVNNGEMTAAMTMSGTGYEWLFMGTADDAENAPESDYIPYEETDGSYVFTVPVNALDEVTDCAAYSKKKETWYDRQLVFRADSLPDTAFTEMRGNTVETLGLADGTYQMEASLSGGSGKASIASPAEITITDGKAVAEIIWSSNKYDYMIVNDEKYLPVSTEENSVFEIPVEIFDSEFTVYADTTAMSTPHEIEYKILINSAT
ncbi:MAG: hypothetical protein IJ666_03565 [Ruminococcus sp.]|nr:hypothetical protein [Ruminococcus sp.]